jgi:uncharacterized protein (UPF0332 family)
MSQVSSLISKAGENIEVADLLLNQGFYDISASRAYYAMFYVAEALLLSRNLAYSSHAAVIAAYGREFAKTNILAPEHHRSLRNAFETRQVGDYSLEYSVSEETAARVLGWAVDFLTDAKEYLATQV